MTKAKKHTLAGLLVIWLTCAMLAMTAGAVLSARADAFAASSEGGAVYAAGKTQKEVLDALDAKVAALNTAIEAVEGKTLEEAYAAGEILAYSNIDNSNGIITSDNKRSGWKIWDDTALMDLKKINAGYNGWGDNSIACLTYNGGDGKAYLVTAEFADNYYGHDGKKLGPAAGDMFRVGEVKYQNFAGGYMKSEGGNVTVTFAKNVAADGTEKPADPVAVGSVGVANDEIAKGVGTTNAALSKAFVDAYNRYKESGFNVGYPFSVVKKQDDLTLQYFRNGDSVSDPWGDANRAKWAYLAYNADEGCAYLIKDEFAFLLDADGGAKKIGSPIGDVFEATDGNRYQNFEKGYMKAEGATPKNVRATYKSGVTVDPSGAEQKISVENNIGMFGPTVKAEHIPAKYTQAQFSTAIKTAYGEKVKYASGETLAAVEKVAYANGYISQKYIDNNGKTHVLAYVADSDAFVYLRPAVVEKLSGDLGAPTGERIEVASVEGKTIYAYPFKNGYIKLTVSQQEKIQGGTVITVINESAIMTQGATYDAEKKFFATQSFSDQITANIVSHTTSGDNVSVDAAYWELWKVAQPSDEELAAAFKKAYDEAFAMGFSAGQPSAEGILFWKSGNSGVIKITLKGGNGNANFWGDNTIMIYNPKTGKVHISTGDIANTYATDGASGNGWATTDMLINTKTGVIVQQFDLIDTVVNEENPRPVYIITQNGVTNKVEGNGGIYDFDANADGGEWVPYLSQFGGSISANPVTVDAVKAGEAVRIDFAQFVNNADGYDVTWTLTSAQGALSEDGVYTLDAMPSSDLTVTVEVYSAFDKLTLTATVKAAGGDKPDVTEPSENGDGKRKGCGSSAAGGCATASMAVLALGAAAVISRKRKNNA